MRGKKETENSCLMHSPNGHPVFLFFKIAITRFQKLSPRLPCGRNLTPWAITIASGIFIIRKLKLGVKVWYQSQAFWQDMHMPSCADQHLPCAIVYDHSSWLCLQQHYHEQVSSTTCNKVTTAVVTLGNRHFNSAKNYEITIAYEICCWPVYHCGKPVCYISLAVLKRKKNRSEISHNCEVWMSVVTALTFRCYSSLFRL